MKLCKLNDAPNPGEMAFLSDYLVLFSKSGK